MTAIDTIRRAFPRAALLLSLIALPVLGMQSVNAGSQLTIEAPSAKKMGAGLVLMVSIQRAQ